MPSTQEFRRRIKSVNNTKQITKAMEMIASIKMQKSIRAITQSRSYIQNAWNILHNLSKKALPNDHPLINQRNIHKIAIIFVTSDKGLCGTYNADLVKKLIVFQKENTTKEIETDVIAIGKIGSRYISRLQNTKLCAEFPGFENIHVSDIRPIFKLVFDDYMANKYDQVIIIYSHFVSSLKQTPVVKQLLPIIEEHIDEPEVWEKSENQIEQEYKFEPSADKVFDGILVQILQTQIYGAILESNASKYSAQMVAMKNATDNAENLIDELQLIYNSVRQDNITREIAEISAGAEAMN
jgi:F-type H+-transporting ATPase subunit gamma